MRRELKLVLLVFCLVVGPAVVLSFLAGRVLGNWQVILQNRMEVAAAKALNDVSRSWRDRLDNARRELQDGLDVRNPMPVASLHTASNAWSSGVFVFSKGQGLIYPAGDDTNRAFGGRDRVSSPSRPSVGPGGVPPFAATNPVAAIREYRQILEQPDLADDLACRVRLRLARACWQAGQLAEAGRTLEPVLKAGEGPTADRALRDPEDGFYYDLVALKVMAEICEAAGDKKGREKAEIDLWRRVVERYDDMAPLQRQLATAQIEKHLDEPRPGSRSREGEATLLAQWRERKRGLALIRERRLRLEQDFLRVAQSGQVADEGWTAVRIGTNDYWVTLATRPAGQPSERPVTTAPAVPASALFYAIQINREGLSAALARSAAVAGVNVELAIEIMDPRADTRDHGPLLAERRLAPPLDRVTLAAYPADPRAFLANVRLQSRLYGWGGFVLIISVVVGGWLMWREAVNEIRAARERSDFAAAVSHDLRTPLSSMRMLAESLYLGRIEDEDKRRRFLKTILKESDRLSRLTDRALYFIRFGQGALRYRMTEGDLGGLVKDVVETFATGIEGEVREAGEKLGAWSAECREGSGRREAGSQESEVRSQESAASPMAGGPGSTPAADDTEVVPSSGGQKWVIALRISRDLPAVRFDAGAMEQVVFNLLDNAVKYSRDSRRIEVSIGEDPRRRHIRVAVKDHGIGIESKDLKCIFKAYHRGGSGRDIAGLGLGLALCRDVVSAHRGRIDVESMPGSGSTFTVVLPAV